VVLDGSQQFYYAQSLLNLGEREQGIQKLYAYLNSEARRASTMPVGWSYWLNLSNLIQRVTKQQ